MRERHSQIHIRTRTRTHTAGRDQGDEGGDDARAEHARPGSFLIPKETYYRIKRDLL